MNRAQGKPVSFFDQHAFMSHISDTYAHATDDASLSTSGREAEEGPLNKKQTKGEQKSRRKSGVAVEGECMHMWNEGRGDGKDCACVFVAVWHSARRAGRQRRGR